MGAPSAAPPTPTMGSIDTSSMGAGLQRRADPWEAVAQTGLDIAAGRSPYALENVGQGAAEGLSQYENVDKAAQDLAARVDEAKARIGETALYQRAMTGNRQQNTDLRAQQLAQQGVEAQDRLALAAERAATAAGRAGAAGESKPSTAGMQEDLVNGLVGTTNPTTGKPYTKAEAEAYVLGVGARNENAQTEAMSAQQRAQQAATNEADLQNYRLSATQRAYASSILASQPTMKPADAAAEAQRLYPGAPPAPAAPTQAALSAGPTSQNAPAGPSQSDIAYLQQNAAGDPSLVQRFAQRFGAAAAAQYAPKVTGVSP
jgi:hypothetical protein